MYQRLNAVGTVLAPPLVVLAPQGYAMLTFVIRSSWAWQSRRTGDVVEEEVRFIVIALDPYVEKLKDVIKEGSVVMVEGHLFPDAAAYFDHRGYLAEGGLTILARHIEVHGQPSVTPFNVGLVEAGDTES